MKALEISQTDRHFVDVTTSIGFQRDILCASPTLISRKQAGSFFRWFSSKRLISKEIQAFYFRITVQTRQMYRRRLKTINQRLLSNEVYANPSCCVCIRPSTIRLFFVPAPSTCQLPKRLCSLQSRMTGQHPAYKEYVHRGGRCTASRHSVRLTCIQH